MTPKEYVTIFKDTNDLKPFIRKELEFSAEERLGCRTTDPEILDDIFRTVWIAFTKARAIEPAIPPDAYHSVVRGMEPTFYQSLIKRGVIPDVTGNQGAAG